MRLRTSGALLTHNTSSTRPASKEEESMLSNAKLKYAVALLL